MTVLETFEAALARCAVLGLTQGQALTLLAKQFVQPKAASAIAEAREQVRGDDDHEVDDVPLVSRSDDGWWVGSWIYIADPVAEEPVT